MEKSLDTIKEEYSTLCREYGHIAYQQQVLASRAQEILLILKDLQEQAGKIVNQPTETK
jgi:hypothetical protein